VYEHDNFLVGRSTEVGQGQDGKVWTKPLEGYVKLNWDGSIDKSTKRIGLGGLARKSRGWVVTTFSSSIPYVQDPDMADVVAA